MFYKWGQFAYRHRRIIPVVVIAIILLMQVLWGSKLGDRLSQEGWEDPGADSTTAAQVEEEVFGRDSNGDIIILVSGNINDQTVMAEANRQITALKEQYPEQIDHINSYFEKPNPQLRSADGTKAFAAIGLKGDGEQTLKDYRAIEDALNDITLPEGADVQIAGATAIADALDQGMADDIARAEKIGLIFVAVILLFVFGGVVAAAMPLVVGILSILGSLSALSLLAQVQQVNVFSQSVITLLGLGLAIDYGLFMVSRFREELDQRGDSPEDIEAAVAETTTTAGKTVFFSALMIGVALSGLLMFPQAFLKSVAYGAISAVVLAAIISVAVLPALFSMLGRNIDKFSVRRTSRKARRIENTVWYKIPAWAMRHSKPVIVSVAGALLLLTLPIVGITFGGINESYLPPSNAVRQAQDDFNETFPAYRTDPVKLVVKGANNDQFVDILWQTRSVTGLASPMEKTKSTPDGTFVMAGTLADRNGGEDVVKQLRAIDVPDGVEVYVGGTPAMEVESIEALLERLPWMAVYMVLATFLLMAVLFGSMILPVKAVLMNILGIGATLGFLTLVFVDGLGAGVLGFTPGPLMSPVLVLIIAILYGLSTDYEVFLVSRMVEARNKGADTDQAIKYGTAHTGSIITAAALIMIVVAAAFAMSEIVMMKYISYGLIISLALDATLIRLLLVPAIMHELREDNWWAPRWIKRTAESFGEGGDTKKQQQQQLIDVQSHPRTGDIPVGETVLASQHARSGVSADEDTQLIPFDELMRRLNG
ncbi:MULTISPECIES: MMPL family transporter [unclassified Corynebacterium]|uniref:MMPL family transporter n=1 Tax=unclassified Corynebacterium TaxID=2624378 RepID=UPI002653A237|nr:MULTISPECIES: MMPL family transporter [unclassified Corynebacterium]MDN8595373.1 MMPL family transporter [Corynebacterium sp. P4_F2]WKK55292.1 MMPL family transporter [Corynebacterium sp. P4-C1]WKK62700.1 MMPL family transporter [Corynebacterium sp. P8-C1]